MSDEEPVTKGGFRGAFQIFGALILSTGTIVVGFFVFSNRGDEKIEAEMRRVDARLEKRIDENEDSIAELERRLDKVEP